MTVNSGREFERYLLQVRAALRGLPEPEIDDILRELRSHIVESASGGTAIDVTLRALGDPVDVAKAYRADNAMAQAECVCSPLVILQALRHTSKSRWGCFVITALYCFAYTFVVILLSAAIVKILAPAHTGLFYTPGNLLSFHLIVDGSPPPGARELLGWWLVPIGLVAGLSLRYPIDWVAQWWIRRYRSANPQAV